MTTRSKCHDCGGPGLYKHRPTSSGTLYYCERHAGLSGPDPCCVLVKVTPTPMDQLRKLFAVKEVSSEG